MSAGSLLRVQCSPGDAQSIRGTEAYFVDTDDVKIRWGTSRIASWRSSSEAKAKAEVEIEVEVNLKMNMMVTTLELCLTRHAVLGIRIHARNERIFISLLECGVGRCSDG